MPKLDDAVLDAVFREARTYNGYTAEPVADADLHAIWDLMKWGPTSANQLPARLVWCTSDDAKEKLAACTSAQNAPKILNAPVSVVIGMDINFHDHLPELFPHVDAKAWFEGNAELREASAFRNSSLQGAYFIIAARLLGLGTGPMSGFDAGKVDAAFFAETPAIRTNFISTLGHGDPATLYPAARARRSKSSTRSSDWNTDPPGTGRISGRCSLRTLVIDTATAACSIALIENGRVVARAHDVVGRGHAERLIPMIAALPDGGRAGHILVDVGPGSFTGVRVGIAAARGLAMGWGAQVAGYSSLSLIAAAAGLPQDVAIVLEGGHGEVFMQVFAPGPVPVTDLASLRPEAAIAALAGRPAIGNGVHWLTALVPDLDCRAALPDAADAVLLPLALATLPPRPLYGRAPDAKVPAPRG